MKLYHIADFGNYGQGDAVSLYISKKGNVLAEYTQEPEYFKSKKEASAFLKEVKSRAFDYQFSIKREIREQKIKKSNLKIVEENFDIEEDEE